MAAKGPRRTISAQEKSKAVKFALRYNKKHGYGGQAVAAHEFGVSQSALSYWMAGYKVAQGRDGWIKAAGLGRDRRARKLAELAVVEAEISTLRKKLATAEAKFQKLKNAI